MLRDAYLAQMRAVVLGLLALVLAGTSSLAVAATKAEIDVSVQEALKRFYKEVESGKGLTGKAVGMLVFPSVFKAGIGIGGEYGEGALLVNGKTADYYSIAAASIGFQLGAQTKTEIIMFMEESALKNFRESEGWKAGVDGSVALVKVGAGGAIDTESMKAPIIGFVFSNKGLMYNLTLEGSKITKLDKTE